MRLEPPDYFYCNRCKAHMDIYFAAEDGICQFCAEDIKGENDE